MKATANRSGSTAAAIPPSVGTPQNDAPPVHEALVVASLDVEDSLRKIDGLIQIVRWANEARDLCENVHHVRNLDPDFKASLDRWSITAVPSFDAVETEGLSDILMCASALVTDAVKRLEAAREHDAKAQVRHD